MVKLHILADGSWMLGEYDSLSVATKLDTVASTAVTTELTQKLEHLADAHRPKHVSYNSSGEWYYSSYREAEQLGFSVVLLPRTFTPEQTRLHIAGLLAEQSNKEEDPK